MQMPGERAAEPVDGDQLDHVRKVFVSPPHVALAAGDFRFDQSCQRECREILHINDGALDTRVGQRKLAAAAGAAGCALLLCYAAILIPFTPSITDIRKAKIDQPSVLVSSDGRRLATLRAMNRRWIALDQEPSALDIVGMLAVLLGVALQEREEIRSPAVVPEPS